MKIWIVLIVLAVVLPACANRGLTINSEVYKTASFSEFETWRWQAWEQDGSVNEIIQDQVKTNIAGELTRKGLIQKLQGEVDFLVNYIVNVRDDLEVDELPSYEGFSERYIGMDTYGNYVNVVEFQMRKQLDEQRFITQITKGTLIVDIVEPKSKELLMRMIAEKPLPDKKVEPAVRQRLILGVVEDLLDNFPPTDVQ